MGPPKPHAHKAPKAALPTFHPLPQPNTGSRFIANPTSMGGNLPAMPSPTPGMSGNTPPLPREMNTGGQLPGMPMPGMKTGGNLPPSPLEIRTGGNTPPQGTMPGAATPGIPRAPTLPNGQAYNLRQQDGQTPQADDGANGRPPMMGRYGGGP